jgi:hypothetical protein
MLVHLANLLADRGLPTRFDPIDNRVWCYAHVIDLACKAVINNLSNSAELPDFIEGQKRNPIALASQVVRMIRGSGGRREAFNDVIDKGNKKGWFKVNDKVVQLKPRQLLRYVRTRWDSCYCMLLRLREMRPVSHYIGHHLRLRLNVHPTGDRLLPCTPRKFKRPRKVQDLRG